MQTCVAHLIRASMHFVSYKGRKKVAAGLRLVNTAPSTDAAETTLLDFEASDLGKRYPATTSTWTAAWEWFIPFLEFPPELRHTIYTTDEIVNGSPRLFEVAGVQRRLGILLWSGHFTQEMFMPTAKKKCPKSNEVSTGVPG